MRSINAVSFLVFPSVINLVPFYGGDFVALYVVDVEVNSKVAVIVSPKREQRFAAKSNQSPAVDKCIIALIIVAPQSIHLVILSGMALSP